jgi:cyclin-dependent kinase regulatory subunit CKS1
MNTDIAKMAEAAISMGIDISRRNRVPRPLTEDERARLDEFIDSIHYSTRWVSLLPSIHTVRRADTFLVANRYSDSEFEYRHVQLPKAMLKAIPAEYHDKSKGTLKLLWEEEWRGMGITQSLGWEHYEVHEPEPHILLFK